jgi:hypothetical protein
VPRISTGFQSLKGVIDKATDRRYCQNRKIVPCFKKEDPQGCDWGLGCTGKTRNVFLDKNRVLPLYDHRNTGQLIHFWEYFGVQNRIKFEKIICGFLKIGHIISEYTLNPD